MGDLEKMLDPRTIALIGADDREGSEELTILSNLLASKGRTVYAVNPDKKKVLDLECYPSVLDIDGHVDLAIMAVADGMILSAAQECGEKGVEGVLITGSEPQGDKGKELREGLREIRKRQGPRIIGPGSAGLILPRAGLNASALTVNPEPGQTALLFQGTAMARAMLYWGVGNHIGFSMFASLGSMADVDFADLIDFLQEDYPTRSIMLYLEHVSNARKFLSASRRFSRMKPIVALKPGRHPRSAEILAAHVGLATGSDMVYDAAFRRVGIVRAKETDDFFDAAKVLVSRALPRGSRLAVVTNSGGIGVIASDILAGQKGRLARLTEKSVGMLDPLRGGSPGAANPVDLSQGAGIEGYAEAVGVCLKDSEVDGVLVIYTPSPSCDPEELAGRIAGLAAKTGKPVVAAWMGGPYSRAGAEVFRKANIPVYHTAEEAVRAYMYMYHYHQGIIFLNETPEELPESETRLTNHLKAIIHNAVKEHKEVLTREEAAGFVKNYGIPILKKGAGNGKAEVCEPEPDEWALRSMRDADFGAVILLISMKGGDKYGSGFAVGLPPLNQVLARHLLEEADFRPVGEFDLNHMEHFLISFSGLVADFPEISEIEIEAVVIPREGVFAKDVTIQIDGAFRKGTAQYPHLAIMPYPTRYIMPWKMADGRDVLLRPIRAEDEPLMKEMMSGLSEETLRVRFFGAMEIDHRMLTQFCNIDYGREISIAAELKEGDRRRMIAGGQLILESDEERGEFALLVSDDFQKQGLGEKLLDVLIGIAQDKGLRQIYGIVLSENGKMLGLARKMGFHSTMLPDGIARVVLELE